MRNFYIDESYVPSFPVGFYLIDLHLTENFRNRPQESIGGAKYYVEVMEIAKLRQRSTTKKPEQLNINKN